jgi:hypothetical protein
VAVIRKTIGVGGDYADIGTAKLAIYAYYPLHIMTDDWELTVMSDFTENTGVPGTADSPVYNGRYVEIKNPDHYLIAIAPSGGGSIKYLRFHAYGGSVSDRMFFNDLIFSVPFINPANRIPVIYFAPGSQNHYVTAVYRNCVFLCNGYAPSGAARGSAIIGLEGASGLQWSNASILNCKFYNFGRPFGSARIGANQIVTVENCSSYLCYKGLLHIETVVATAQYNIRNYVAVSDSVDYESDFSTLANINFTNCADSDNSLLTCGGNLVDCKHDIVPVNEFESLTSTSADFLRLFKGRLSTAATVDPDRGFKPLRCKFHSGAKYSYGGNVLPDGGIPPTFSTTDLAGEPYGRWGEYPIGCYNAEIAY